MRISDWSSDVCSSDLGWNRAGRAARAHGGRRAAAGARRQAGGGQIGRATCRERVCTYVKISVVAVSLKKKSNHLRLRSLLLVEDQPIVKHQNIHTRHTTTGKLHTQ